MGLTQSHGKEIASCLLSGDFQQVKKTLVSFTFKKLR